MEIKCHTNLDIDATEVFPHKLPCRPMMGDIIESNMGLELEVVRVTFRMYKESPSRIGWDSYCDVELHLPKYRFENITQFDKWYKAKRMRSL